MRIVATSDLHGFLPDPATLPEGDVLLIGGDIMPVNDHSQDAQLRFCDDLEGWLEDLDYYHVIAVAGNHDFLFDPAWVGETRNRYVQVTYTEAGRVFADSLPWTYLRDEWRVIGDLTFYGTPWSRQYGPWAFMAEEDELDVTWSMIPEDVDVLLVHGPPLHAGDLTADGVYAGSRTLRYRIDEVKPQLVVTGHIHEAYGESMVGQTKVANVSYLNRHYRPQNPPMVFDVEPRR